MTFEHQCAMELLVNFYKPLRKYCKCANVLYKKCKCKYLKSGNVL